MNVALTALPFLLFLACPLMMVFCVLGMRKSTCTTPSPAMAPASTESREARVAALESQLRVVSTELRTLQLEDASAPPVLVPARAGGDPITSPR